MVISKINFEIEKDDFEKMYNKLLELYKKGNLSTVEISHFANMSIKYGYEPNFNFELEKPKNCDCTKYPKVLSTEGFLCANCNKLLRKRDSR